MRSTFKRHLSFGLCRIHIKVTYIIKVFPLFIIVNLLVADSARAQHHFSANSRHTRKPEVLTSGPTFLDFLYSNQYVPRISNRKSCLAEPKNSPVCILDGTRDTKGSHRKTVVIDTNSIGEISRERRIRFSVQRKSWLRRRWSHQIECEFA